MDAVRGNRFLLTGAMTRYPRDPELDRPELAGDVERIAGLFSTDFGYTHLQLPDSPTQAQLRDVLRDFCKAPERGPEDLVAVYLACHGAILEPNNFVLLPSDIDPDDLVPLAVTPQVLVDWLLRDTNVRRLLLMLDTCYSGQGGQDAAGAAVRWVNQPGAADRPGVVLVTATHPWQQALPGVFSRAFERAVGHLATGGHAQEDLPLDAVVEVINADCEKPTSQTVACHELGKTGRPPPFLPNPRYRSRLIDVDLLEQERARHTEQREAHLRERFLPATRWFTGRHAALIDLAAWLNNPAVGRALIVTGNAGSGKTALLGLLAALSDRDQAPSVPRDGLPEAFTIADSSIAEAIYAGTMTTAQVRGRIAAAAGLRVNTTQQLIDGLKQRDVGPLVVLVDALDEAADPGGLISGLLSPLMTECADTLRLLMGTRPHLLTAKLLGTPESGRYLPVDLDSGRYADPASVRTYIRRILLAEDALDSAYRPPGLYRTAPADVLDAVTEAIGQAAGSSFLVARITATTEAAAARLPNPNDPAWRAALPQHAGQAMRRDLRLRLGGEADKAERLLLPLAYAQGNGLPWENIWPRVVEALSPGCGYGNHDLTWLRRAAGSYAIEGLANGRSAYRLYHQALTEHLLDGRDQQADQQAITDALIALVPPRAGGARDWAAAHSYTRTHLATHAARAGRLDELLTDPQFLLAADQQRLLDALPAARSASAVRAAAAYRSAVPHLNGPSSERFAYLQLAARCNGAADLADAARAETPPTMWQATWAAWTPSAPNDVVTGHNGRITNLVAARVNGRMTVISAGDDGTVRMTDLHTGSAVGEPIDTGHLGGIRTMKVTQVDGRQIAITTGGRRDDNVQLWDLQTRVRVGRAIATGQRGGISRVLMAQVDGRPLAITIGTSDSSDGSGSGTLALLDLHVHARLGKPIAATRPFPIQEAAITQVDDRPIIVTTGGRWLALVDLQSRMRLGKPIRTDAPCRQMRVTQVDGRPIAIITNYDAMLRLWDLRTRSPLADPIDTGLRGEIETITLTEVDGRPIALIMSGDALLQPWDLRTRTPLGPPIDTGHSDSIRAMMVTHVDGCPAVITSGSRGDYGTTFRLWDMRTFAPLCDPIDTGQVEIRRVPVSYVDGRPIAITHGGSSRLRLWHLLAIGDSVETGHPDNVSLMTVTWVNHHPTAIIGDDNGLRLSDLRTQLLLGDPIGTDDRVSTDDRVGIGNRVGIGEISRIVAAHVDGRPVAITSGSYDDATLRVWDLHSRVPACDVIDTRQPYAGRTMTVAYVDGRPAVITVGGGMLRLWDLRTRAPLGEPIDTSTSSIGGLTATVIDGRLIAITGGHDGTLRLWDLRTRAPLGEPIDTPHTVGIRNVVRTEVGRHPAVITVGDYSYKAWKDDNTLQLWDLRTRARLTRPFAITNTIINDQIRTVVVSQVGGHSVVVANGEGFQASSLWLWDLAPVRVGRTRLTRVLRSHIQRVQRLGVIALSSPVNDFCAREGSTAGCIYVACGQNVSLMKLEPPGRGRLRNAWRLRLGTSVDLDTPITSLAAVGQTGLLVGTERGFVLLDFPDPIL